MCKDAHLFMAEWIFKPKTSDMRFHALFTKPKIYAVGFQILSNNFPWFLWKECLPISPNLLNHRGKDREARERVGYKIQEAHNCNCHVQCCVSGYGHLRGFSTLQQQIKENEGFFVFVCFSFFIQVLKLSLKLLKGRCHRMRYHPQLSFPLSINIYSTRNCGDTQQIRWGFFKVHYWWYNIGISKIPCCSSQFLAVLSTESWGQKNNRISELEEISEMTSCHCCASC